MADPPRTMRSASLTRLIPDASAYVERLRYHPTYAQRYRSVWEAFRQFLRDKRLPNRINDDAIGQFLKSRDIPLVGPIYAPRLGDIRRSILALHEFAKFGAMRSRHAPRQEFLVPGQLASTLHQYETYCVERKIVMPRSIRRHRTILRQFFLFLHRRGISAPRGIRSSDISAFMRSRCHLNSKTIYREATCLRSYFRIVYALGLIGRDLAPEVPRVRFRPHETLPSVWPKEQVDALLRIVDRESAVGKRNFAVLILAARLAMRVGDIRELKLQDIDWRRGCLSYRQPKTGVALELPLSDEVAEALIDYLRNGRPHTEHREVFVRAVAPFSPFSENQNLWYIVTKYRRMAGISRPASCRRGLHSLRHTLATDLLAKGVPIETIGSILGHATVQATHVYTAVDIELLRTAALDLDEDANG